MGAVQRQRDIACSQPLDADAVDKEGDGACPAVILHCQVIPLEKCYNGRPRWKGCGWVVQKTVVVCAG
jgi:hypothetical protein